MKTPLLVLGICVSFFAAAQTINLSDTLSTGDAMTYYNLDSNATNYSEITGTGVTWDYSDIGGYAIANVNNVIDRADSDFGTDFPAANYTEEFENSVQTYFSNDAGGSQVIVHGFVFQELTNDFVIKYDVDQLISYQFPMSQGDTYTDAMEGTAVVPVAGDVAITGEATITADGSGTLIIGTNTYSDVLRVHTIEVSEGIVLGAAAVITRESYVYYDITAFNMPIFVHATVHAELGIVGDLGFTAVYSKDEIVEGASIKESTKKLNIAVYPNPAAGKNATITSDQNTESITIYSSLGQVMMTIINPKVSENIDLTNYANGVYFIQAVKGDAARTEKFIVK
ncbi:T9SS type A sorting domain-containing protein [Crocinitomix sp.]|nr:T9SS type A sorting domain-containing protein [Crocinitomix sp.]